MDVAETGLKHNVHTDDDINDHLFDTTTGSMCFHSTILNFSITSSYMVLSMTLHIFAGCGHNSQKFLRQSYDNLRNFLQCPTILRQIYDNSNFQKISPQS